MSADVCVCVVFTAHVYVCVCTQQHKHKHKHTGKIFTGKRDICQALKMLKHHTVIRVTIQCRLLPIREKAIQCRRFGPFAVEVESNGRGESHCATPAATQICQWMDVGSK
jgi:hypothetical protein